MPYDLVASCRLTALLMVPLLTASGRGVIGAPNAVLAQGALDSHAQEVAIHQGAVPTPHGPLYYEEQGQGDALVVLHGFGGRWRREQWSPLLDSLGSSHRVIGVDVRGHGRSPKPHDPGAYGLELVRDVERVLDHLGLGQATLVGYSMGGIVALKAAQELPGRVRAVVLIGQGWLRQEELEAMAGGASGMIGRDTTGLAESTREMFRTNDIGALSALVAAYPELYVSRDALRELSLPVLAVVGSLDPRLARAEALTQEAPNARLEVVEGRDHGSIVADAEYVRRIERSGVLAKTGAGGR